MSNSLTTDGVTNEIYPDVLSVSYTNVTLYTPPFTYEPDSTWTNAPWIIMDKLVGGASRQDIVLMLNSVPHMSLIEGIADALTIPVLNDLNIINSPLSNKQVS
jgi:hypothetical protein